MSITPLQVKMGLMVNAYILVLEEQWLNSILSFSFLLSWGIFVLQYFVAFHFATLRIIQKYYCTYIPSPLSLSYPLTLPPTLGHHRAMNWAFCISGNTKGLVSRCQGIQTHWLKIDIWLVILWFFVCWRDFSLWPNSSHPLLKPLLTPASTLAYKHLNSLKLHPWGGLNPSYSVCLWNLKSAEIIYYLFQATSAEGALLSQSLGCQSLILITVS